MGWLCYNSGMKKTAFFVLLAFLASLLSSPLQAEPEEAPAPKDLLQIADLAIPETLGKIEGRFAGNPEKNDRWVLLIQDIHAHLNAQENISAIVDHLNQVYGIETFALEGGWSKTKLFKSNKLPNSRAKQQLARALLEEEYITGPAYSGLFSPSPLKLVGIESKELYESNRRAFLAHLKGKEEAEEKIKAAEADLAAQKQQAYHPELLAFDAGLVQFRKGSKTEIFLPSLFPAAESVQAGLSDLDQMKLFREVLDAESTLDKQKLESEAKRLVENSGDPRLSFEELLRSGKITEAQLQHYPEAQKFKEILKLEDAISHHAFFNQIETAIGRIKEKMFQTETEKNLDARSERLLLAEKIIRLEAVPADLKRAAVQQKQMKEEMAQAGLRDALQKGIRFYNLAKKRDASFFQNIVSQPLLSGNIAVVAGGFHTEGLTARFEKMGISYMIITPSLGEGNPPPNQALYYKRMAENQTLAHLQNRFFTAAFDEGFTAGVKQLAETNNIPQAIETVFSFRKKAESAPAAGNGSGSIEAFMALGPEEQKSEVEKWLEETKAAKIPIVLAARNSVFQELFKDPAGLAYWKHYVAPDRNVTVGELRDNEDYLTELLGMKAAVIRLNAPAGADIGALLIKKFLAGESKRPLALIDAGYQTKDFLVLPVSPASFLAARLLLESKLKGTVTEDFLRRTGSLLNEIFTEKNLLEQAA